MKILIACEESAVVRDAFRARGHDAWSCDLLPTRGDPKWHYQRFVEDILPQNNWDMVIAFPPCTHLCVSGARWFKEKQASGEQKKAVEFFLMFTALKGVKLCIENPVGIMSTRFRKPDQIIQPWQFGHGETKATCLWLKGLPLLKPTNIVHGREARIHRMAPSPDRARMRSETFKGIAEAMANQWGIVELAKEKP